VTRASGWEVLSPGPSLRAIVSDDQSGALTVEFPPLPEAFRLACPSWQASWLCPPEVRRAVRASAQGLPADLVAAIVDLHTLSSSHVRYGVPTLVPVADQAA
jgi:hypothetical protein